LQIVIARAQKTALIPTGRHVMRDRNWFPEFTVDWEGKAAIWLRKGKKEDIERAKEHALRDGWTVFIFPSSEPDPLGKARAEIIKHAKERELTCARVER
jgi:hypothetical protein